MGTVKTICGRRCAKFLCIVASLGLLSTAAWADPPQQPQGAAVAEKDSASAKLRPIRLAIFDMDAARETGVDGPAITDQLNKMLAALPQVTLVNRDQIKKVADEHQMALSGLVSNADAVKVGKFLSAQYIVVGRASKIGQQFYLVLKIVDVETTVQTTVSAKAATESGFEAVLERLEKPLADNLRQLQRPTTAAEDTTLTELRKLAEPFADKVLLVAIDESHVGRPLRDPAAQMAVMQRLRSLGLSVIVPTEPVSDWKKSLLKTGMYGEQTVDFLLEGEGTTPSPRKFKA